MFLTVRVTYEDEDEDEDEFTGKLLAQVGVWYVHREFSWLLIDLGKPSPLWVAPFSMQRYSAKEK